MGLGFWLRWTRRDMWARKWQVLGLALLIAFGTGSFGGFNAFSEQRQESFDESYALLHAHDLRIALVEGAFVETGTLLGALREAGLMEMVTGAEERLIASVQLDVSSASPAEDTVLVPGLFVSVGANAGFTGNSARDGSRSDGRMETAASAGTAVDTVHAKRGRTFGPEDAGERVVALDFHFAEAHDLPSAGEIIIGGEGRTRYVGQVLHPDHFWIVAPSGGMLAQEDYGVVFAPLETVQALTGRGSRVNELVLTTAPGVSSAELKAAAEVAFAAVLPETGVIFTRGEDETVRESIQSDIEDDQQFLNIVSFILLGGAAFASLNLMRRMMQMQRKQMGIAMALGLRRRSLAIRPLAFAALISLLGVIFGLVIGLVIGDALASFDESVEPLPVRKSAFQLNVFVQAAFFGFLLPFLVAVITVRRAVRSRPLDLLRPRHLTVTTRRGDSWLSHFAWGHSVLGRMPARNLARAPVRTVLTFLSVGAAISILFCMVSVGDAFGLVVDESEQELLRGAPARVRAGFSDFELVESSALQAVTAMEEVEKATPILSVSATLLGDFEDFGDRESDLVEKGGQNREAGKEIDVALDFLDFENEVWQPLPRGSLDGAELGLVLSEKAAKDLGIKVGGTVWVRHPVRAESGIFGLMETEFPVLALHDIPLRQMAFAGIAHAEFLGLAGHANALDVVPVSGMSGDELQRHLLSVPGIATADPFSTLVDQLRETMSLMSGTLTIITIVAVLIVFLVALNITGIGMEEHRRDHATMFAFGLPVRRVLGVVMIENGMIGLIGAILGIGGGALLLQYTLATTSGASADLDIQPALSLSVFVLAVLAGVLPTALAPFLSFYKLRRLVLPSTLRIVE